MTELDYLILVKVRSLLGDFKILFEQFKETNNSLIYVSSNSQNKYLLKLFKKNDFSLENVKKLKKIYLDLGVLFEDSILNFFYDEKLVELYYFIECNPFESNVNLLETVANIFNKIYLNSSPSTNHKLINFSINEINNSFFIEYEKKLIQELFEEFVKNCGSLKQSFCHNDLKPPNFLFREDGVVSIIDFQTANYNYVIYDISIFLSHLLYYYKLKKISFEKINFFLNIVFKNIPLIEFKMLYNLVILINLDRIKFFRNKMDGAKNLQERKNYVYQLKMVKEIMFDKKVSSLFN
ncbi:aminoglycoside phosphotransferase family protein [Candidatus Woesearchaeota archaeon]|jgi:serine/threonine protein kinase|nr:aminoglycoside phosphotransferase family protein [Candidatus Woesearchaeota archaeon]